jgi:hypothetical protein
LWSVWATPEFNNLSALPFDNVSSTDQSMYVDGRKAFALSSVQNTEMHHGDLATFIIHQGKPEESRALDKEYMYMYTLLKTIKTSFCKICQPALAERTKFTCTTFRKHAFMQTIFISKELIRLYE